MIEGSLYDIKSLRTIMGGSANFAELAKDAVAFANAQGGVLSLSEELAHGYSIRQYTAEEGDVEMGASVKSTQKSTQKSFF